MTSADSLKHEPAPAATPSPPQPLAEPAGRGDPQPPAQPLAQPLAKTVGHGAALMVSGVMISKFATLIAQIVLGWILIEDDFGLFAAALSMSNLINIVRDGGANAILTARGVKEYDKLGGPLFWMSAVVCSLSALLTIALAFPIAWNAYDKPQPTIGWIMIITAASTPMVAVFSHQSIKLRLDLRFKEFARIQIVSGVLRQVFTIALALTGLGALSFAWAQFLCAVYEMVASCRANRVQPWRRSPEFHTWPAHIRQGLWSVLGALAYFSVDFGPYFVLSLLMTEDLVGIFYFAFQLTAQMGVLLGYAVQLVLIPVFARLNDEPKRQADALLRSMRAIMLAGSVSCIALALVMEPLEDLLWNGRWESAVLPVMALGVFFPWRVTLGLTTAVLHAQGRFKRHALLTLVEGLVFSLSTAIAAFFTSSLTTICIASGAGMMMARVASCILVLRGLGVPARTTLWTLVPSWALAILSGAAVVGAEHVLGAGPALDASLTRALTSLLQGQLPPGLLAVVASAPADLLMTAALGLVFGGIFLALARPLLKDHLWDAVNVLPDRLRRPMTKLMGLRASGAPGGE